MTTWRDIDSDSPRVGLILRGDGASLYVGKRLYRAYWGGPHRWWILSDPSGKARRQES